MMVMLLQDVTYGLDFFIWKINHNTEHFDQNEYTTNQPVTDKIKIYNNLLCH